MTFFIADRIGLGEEFFVTDGTAAGTRLLADSSPGGSSAAPVPFGILDGRLLWWAWDPDRHPTRFVGTLWSSDGTVEGTDQLLPGGVSIPEDQKHDEFALAGGFLYFVGCELESCSIWASDGTSAGTRPVHPIANAFGAEELAVAAGRIFFTTDAGLWALNPATGGATLVLEKSDTRRLPFKLLGRGPRLFFAADAGRGEQIWINDGTPEGTQELSGFSGADILGMREGPGSLVYIVLRDFAEGTEIWRTDGTWAGTSPVTGFTDPRALDFDTSDELLILGERVFMPARSGSSSEHLGIWVSDGSPETTRPLVPCEEDCPEAVGSPVAAGGRAVFALRYVDRIELWSSDGTPAGTGPVAKVCDCLWALEPVTLSEHGTEVGITAAGVAWISDGTPEGTRPIHDPEVVKVVLPGEIGRVGACWLFPGLDERGVEPWCSEGEPGSARILADLEVRSRGSDPEDI